jgi:hypothetical protein
VRRLRGQQRRRGQLLGLWGRRRPDNHPGPTRPKPPARKPPVQEQDDTSVPTREPSIREPASKIAYPAGYDIYDYFLVEDPAVAEERYAALEGYEARPRVRVYGCCLPIALGMLLAFLVAVVLVGNLVIGAL